MTIVLKSLLLMQVRAAGKICILDIDVQGVQKVKTSGLDCKYVFIAPPSMAALEDRLRGRGSETEEKISIRLKNAVEEMSYGQSPGNFDQVLVNTDIEATFQDLTRVILSWYPSVFHEVEIIGI